jgi:hypothetical protein
MPILRNEMATTELRPVQPSRFRRRRDRGSVEALLVRTQELARARQDLRLTGAGTAALERNRVALARAQWELSLALIERYCAAA